MSNKKFKINPKVWPKEYTFEEFKQLNPNVNENLLINYYNKHIQEYAENRSRHLKYFNNTKDNLSKELNLLNEKLINTTSEWSDGDMNVGPAAAARKYFSNVYSEGSYINSGSSNITVPTPGIGNGWKPLKEISINFWWMQEDGYAAKTNTSIARTNQTFIDVVAGGGWIFRWDAAKVSFQVLTRDSGSHSHGNAVGWTAIDYGNGPIVATGTNGGVAKFVATGHNRFNTGSNNPYYNTNHHNSGSSNVWNMFTGVFDGRYLSLYVNGELAGDSGAVATVDAGANCEGISYLDKHYSKDYNLILGANGNAEGSGVFATGSFNNLAIWDASLNAQQVRAIYNSGIPKYDLKAKSSYEPYTFYENLADNLQLWLKLDNIYGTTVPDSSGHGRDGLLNNGTADTHTTSSIPN